MSVRLRPMRAGDVEAVRECAVMSFAALAATLHDPPPDAADSPQQQMYRQEESLRTADGCSRAVLSSSRSPAAMHRYVRAGFVVHPCVSATGTVRDDGLPAGDEVREGLDRALADAVDRRVRASRRGADHAAMARSTRGWRCRRAAP